MILKMDIRYILLLFAFIYLLTICYVFSAPVDPLKPTQPSEHENNNNEVNEKKIETEMDDLGLEYGRYLQQVVEALEQDKDFAKKLENVSQDEIKNGAIARELDFVSHSVRTRLDELKRIELDRLRKLARKEHEMEERGNGDDRRWRTFGEGVNNALSDNVGHLDHGNPHSFEAEDLQKLILSATKDLEELDQKRREDFKQYEMEKELEYRESLNNMTDSERQETQKKHDNLMNKHKEHPKVHHPGSKQQLEQVWEEQDHMPKEEFNPKVFFTMHDVNGDGFLDPQEVEAILTLEIRKVYSEKNPEDDPNEMQEEYHRMREHIYKEADVNRDGLISKKEFLDFTHRMEFERDDGWKGLDETQVYNEQDLQQYQQHRQQLNQQQQHYGAYQQYPHPQYYPEGYHVPQPGHVGQGYPNQHQLQQQMIHPNQQQHMQGFQQQHPDQAYYPPQHQQLPPQHQQQLQHQQLPPQHQQQFVGQPPHAMDPQMQQHIQQQQHQQQQQALYQQQQQIHAQQQQQQYHQQQQQQQHGQQQQQKPPQQISQQINQQQQQQQPMSGQVVGGSPQQPIPQQVNHVNPAVQPINPQLSNPVNPQAIPVNPNLVKQEKTQNIGSH